MSGEDTDDDQGLRVPILTKLFRRDLWGKSYTTIENALKKLPVHRHGEAKEEVQEMRQDGLVILHKGGKCVSLNPSAKEEIESILKDHLPDYFF